ncbi:MAG TPA: glutamate--tRNA ligase [Gemmatimonadales bacterium]|jgi:glutamyl-tRNA synthetase|nr:glutamate--tRNA ligase [Gemmatimonadales bacterium]
MSTPPRVRFAPSPTGYLHVGGARTALFNWLYARKTGGVFVLRIEDTDQQRSTEENTQVILDGLRWLGLQWDEGPVFQGEAVARHRADAERLLAEGKAYRCFCTKEELEAQRKATLKGAEAFKYDRRCDRLPAAEVAARMTQGMPFVIRFRMPQEDIAWNDAVHGTITFHGRDLDDLIILRADGTPIYNMAVVSDDIAMRITHVIRGDDHISNTPKQLALYRALGAAIPTFAHVPMILGADGKKLSKRHGATAVGDYQNLGILPAAMRNFLALLGWSPGEDREIMAEAELIALFSLEGIQKKPAVFDTTKLEWMNGQYLSLLPTEELLEPVARELDRLNLNYGSREVLVPYINAVKARSRTLLDVARQVAVRLDSHQLELDEKGRSLIKQMGDGYFRSLALAHETLSAISEGEWRHERILAALKDTVEKEGLKLGDLLQPIRVALTGSTVSEPVNELLEVVGRSSALARLTAAARSLANSQ